MNDPVILDETKYYIDYQEPGFADDEWMLMDDLPNGLLTVETTLLTGTARGTGKVVSYTLMACNPVNTAPEGEPGGPEWRERLENAYIAHFDHLNGIITDFHGKVLSA